MSEFIVDLETGEARDLDGEWAALHDHAAGLCARRPETPLEVDRLLRELEDEGVVIADFLRSVNNARYAAEILYSRALNAALARHGEDIKSVTVARANAELDAAAEFEQFLNTKAIYHHVEDIGRALARKHYGLMNTNKGIQGMTASTHRRTP